MDDNGQRDWHFRQLERTLRTLAASGSSQPSFLPGLEPKPDDLAFDVGHWCGVVRDEYGDDLSREQVDALAALEARLETMSRDGAEFDPDLWTTRAVETSVHWEQVRALAAAALEAFGWPASGGGAISRA